MQPSTTISKKQIFLLFGQKSTGKALIAIATNWVLFITGVLLSTYLITHDTAFYSIPAYILAAFLTACALRGFDNLTHEASHNNIFPKNVWNRKLQFLYAFPVLRTVQDYWLFHRDHHKNYRDDKAHDPDTLQNIRWGIEDLEQEKSFKRLFFLYVVRFFLLYYTFDSIKYNILPHCKSKQEWRQRFIFWAMIFSLVLVTQGWTWFVWGYAVPFFIFLPYIRFITESSKHINVNLEDDFANSRNNIGWLHQYLLHPHHDGFHQMHHYLAGIPFYNLKKAYKFMTQDDVIHQRVVESRGFFQTIQQVWKTG